MKKYLFIVLLVGVCFGQKFDIENQLKSFMNDNQLFSDFDAKELQKYPIKKGKKYLGTNNFKRDRSIPVRKDYRSNRSNSSSSTLRNCSDPDNELEVSIVLTEGDWPDEISWFLIDSLSNETILSGDAPFDTILCLPIGYYRLQGLDSYGDGWNNSVLTIVDVSNGTEYLNLTLLNGYEAVQTFYLGPIAGCTDPFAENYDSSANTDDGSCEYLLCEENKVFLYCSPGDFPEEVSWSIYDLIGTEIITGIADQFYSICIPTGEYKVLGFDTYGDGWDGSTLTGLDSSDNVLFSWTLNSGFVDSTSFWVGPIMTTWEGPVWHVSNNGSDEHIGSQDFPFSTIQKAIDMASDGDTVFVLSGTYSENVNFNEKNVVVIGENRDNTFIDGGGNNRLINLLTGNNVVTLESFTIKNGYSNWGGALTFGNGDTLTLNHCNFINNVAEQGGGVFNSNGGIVDIFNCLFENNSSVNGRSVINIGNDVDDENNNISISISHSTFNDNNSDSKGAVNVWAADSVEISNCTFSNNYSGSYAGALNVHDVNYFIMENSNVLNNRCVTGSGGGISTWDLNYGLIKNSSIIGNVSEQGNGGGMVLWSNANMEIINSTIADNQAQLAQDLFIKHNSTLKLENSVVYNRNTYDQIGLYDSFLEFDDIEQACSLTLEGTNLIRGGLTHIYKDTLSTINSNGSLILSNPLFCEPENGDYSLAENSPLISLLYQENIQVGVTSAVGCGAINPYPIINFIQNHEIFEDEQLSINILASSELGLELSYYAESNTLELPVSMDSTVLTIEPQDDWNGVGIVSVFVFDTNGLYDSTSFDVTVLPINDSPTNFELIYPTVLDTIPVSVDTDETIPFTWESSIDVDSEVSYKLTITLDYFGTTYTNEYENISDTTYGVSAYEYAILMINLNLPRWNIDYTVEASDGEYTVISDDGEFVLDNTSLSIEKSMLPKEFALYQNYPNPFNPITSLRYDLPNDGLVNITIYDMMGRIVKTLVNGSQTAGFKSVQWNATNDRNEPVSAGLYLYTIQAGEFRQTKKMVLLK